MKILLATGNLHKKAELSSILTNHELILPKEMGFNFYHEEVGKTYFENAYGKALTLYNLSKMAVLADDSGLSVDALDGAPGIYSARFGMTNNELLSDREKCHLILDKMENEKNRRAFFVSNIVFMLSPYRYYCAQETLEGEIYSELRGENGFGYDPIMWLPEYQKTVAELSAEEKNAISHRAKSALQIKKIIDSLTN